MHINYSAYNLILLLILINFIYLISFDNINKGIIRVYFNLIYSYYGFSRSHDPHDLLEFNNSQKAKRIPYVWQAILYCKRKDY